MCYLGDQCEMFSSFCFLLMQVFDRNNDGFVSANEIKQVMKSLGHKLTNGEVQEIIRRGDSNGDGKLNYEGRRQIIFQQLT